MIFPKSKRQWLGLSILITSWISLLLLIIIIFALLEFKVSDNANYWILDIIQNYGSLITVFSWLIAFLFKYSVDSYDSICNNKDSKVSIWTIFYPFLLILLMVFLSIIISHILIKNPESITWLKLGVLSRIRNMWPCLLWSIGAIAIINGILFYSIDNKETQKIKKITKATVETKIESTTTTTELD